MKSNIALLFALALANIFAAANCKGTEDLPPDVVSSANFLFNLVKAKITLLKEYEIR